jgi:FKBP-type peptidyl-prolyl cis-trans isomerase
VFLFFLTACGGKVVQPKKTDWSKKKSTDLNRELAIRQEMQIKMYLEQHSDWQIKETGTGLRYWIYKNGTGDSSVVGMHARVETEITLLDGTSCYKTASDEYDEFVIDRSDVESGVQEGIKKMRVGDKAKLIIPSHLAHGLIGDLDKIPPLAVLVVDISLIELVP